MYVSLISLHDWFFRSSEEDEFKHEHSVDDPEVVASMVDM